MMGKLLAVSLLAFLFFSCGNHIPKPTLQYEGVAISSPQVDSLRAKFTLQVANTKAEPEELEGVLWAVPGQRYRIEINGPMGIGIASLLWQQEQWQVYVPSEDLHTQGVGNRPQVPGLALPDISIHRLLGPIWGEWNLPDSNQVTRYALPPLKIWEFVEEDSTRIRAEFSLATGNLLAIVFVNDDVESQIRIEARTNEFRVMRGGLWLLTFIPTEVKKDLKWKSSLWRI